MSILETTLKSNKKEEKEKEKEKEREREREREKQVGWSRLFWIFDHS